MLVASIPSVEMFCLLRGSAIAVDFAILLSHVWYRQTVPRIGLRSPACGPGSGTARRSHFWDRVQVHFSTVFRIRVEEA